MYIIFFLLAASIVHAWQVQPSASRRQDSEFRESGGSMQAEDLKNASEHFEVSLLHGHEECGSRFAMLLLALNPLAAFHIPCPGACIGLSRRMCSQSFIAGLDSRPTISCNMKNLEEKNQDHSFRDRINSVKLDEAVVKEVTYMVYHRNSVKRKPIPETLPVLGLPLTKPFNSKPVFVAAAQQESSLLQESVPEIAFIGRSNVGKSCLINAFIDKPNLAHVSHKPGRTQSINWYEIERRGKKFRLVDMPGYGFAFAPQEKVERWHDLSAEYLSNRKSLKLVCVLIDSKTGMKQTDLQLLSFLEANRVKYTIVFTKADIAGESDYAARIVAYTLSCIRKARHLVRPVSIVSSRTGAGVGRLQRRVLEAALGEDPMKHIDGGWNLKKNWVKLDTLPLDIRPGRFFTHQKKLKEVKEKSRERDRPAMPFARTAKKKKKKEVRVRL